ncbi:MAG: DUF4129 domain-containing protein [Flavobacteriales bacterium]
MAWKKSRLLFIPVWVMLLTGFAQGQPLAQDTSRLWTTEQWEKTTEGLDYSDTNEKKEEKKKEDGAFELPDDDSFNFLESLNRFFTSPLGKTMMLFLIIGILAYTLFRLLTRARVNKDQRIQADLAYFLEHLDESFEESDMDRMLRLALEATDHKTAVRILYLRLLQLLHLQRWIVWKKDKTNRDFLNEMRMHEGYRAFRTLTLAYEIVWYGDTEITRYDFDRLNALFAEFQSTLQPKADAAE